MLLELKNINKHFGDNHVLKGVNLQTESGKAFGLLGRNGAGKTTTIRIIMGVFAQDDGEVLLDGKPIDRNKITFGYMPEERGLYAKKKVLDQIVYFNMLRGQSKSDAMEDAKYWLDRLDMSQHANKKLETLSKGNQQKIQLAVTLGAKCDIVILDEPFSGLDPVNAMVLEEVVSEEIAKNRLVFFSSHQMFYVEKFCQNIAIINKGNVVLHGEIAEIKRSYPRNKIVIDSKDLSKVKENISYNNKFVKDELVVELPDESKKFELMQQLLNKNIDFDSFKVFEPSLNDIFVEYTEDSIWNNLELS